MLSHFSQLLGQDSHPERVLFRKNPSIQVVQEEELKQAQQLRIALLQVRQCVGSIEKLSLLQFRHIGGEELSQVWQFKMTYSQVRHRSASSQCEG